LAKILVYELLHLGGKETLPEKSKKKLFIQYGRIIYPVEKMTKLEKKSHFGTFFGKSYFGRFS
jgi:hypothetical protein